MIRFVLLDYLGGIKEGWKRLWKAEPVVIIWDYIFIGILWASDFYEEMFLRPAVLCGYSIIIFIILFGYLISRMYPGKLEKTLYLCPLTQEEKKQYVETGYRLRIALPMFLYVLAGILWQIFGIIPLISAAEIGIWLFFYLGCANIYCLPEQGKDIFGQGYPVKGLEIFQAINQILGIGKIMGIYRLISEDYNVWNSRIYGGIFILLQILLYIIMRKKLYPRIMERAVCYENND